MMSQMDWGWGGMIFGPIMMIVIVAPDCTPGALAR